LPFGCFSFCFFIFIIPQTIIIDFKVYKYYRYKFKS
jgi:hypothetical protein